VEVYNGGNTAAFASAVETLANRYAGMGIEGERAFVKQVGYCFAGIPLTTDHVNITHNPRRTRIIYFLDQSDLQRQYVDPGGYNIQHYTFFFHIAYFQGGFQAVFSNFFREAFNLGDPDVGTGNVAALHGTRLANRRWMRNNGTWHLTDVASWIRADLITR
jgi:hypothetical protein